VTLLSMLLTRAGHRPAPVPEPDDQALTAAAGRAGDRAWRTFIYVATRAERPSLPNPCGNCGAGEWELCVSAAGLPSSLPCNGRQVSALAGVWVAGCEAGVDLRESLGQNLEGAEEFGDRMIPRSNCPLWEAIS
jgi:hypothetical protein